ncbi:hypothetical protein B0F90DRAFT_75675 [Multifurca ochricompacta]|uniref:Uncharacterized protein n=1 Tax=Multifurca ochricompacta TaxID=376703 RepID=A0AAD4MFI3_9AGAM|nr:hypothetical protein B0F90DRAFT_75675 [Multifurca ochricompacta]
MEGMEKVPYYVLISSTQPTATNATTGTTGTGTTGTSDGVSGLHAVLSHPILQYHYTNDSPLSLLPRSPNEQVLVLDYDPVNPGLTHAQSISGSSAITGIKVTDAPGAGSSEGESGWSNKMFVLETTSFDSRFAFALEALYDEHDLDIVSVRRIPADADEGDPRVVLAQFKQNNGVIQQVLDYCESTDVSPTRSKDGL